MTFSNLYTTSSLHFTPFPRLAQPTNLLKQKPRRMVDMIICESSDGKVTMIVIRLVADEKVLVISRFSGGSGEVLGEELPGFVEVVGCALQP